MYKYKAFDCSFLLFYCSTMAQFLVSLVTPQRESASLKRKTKVTDKSSIRTQGNL